MQGASRYSDVDLVKGCLQNDRAMQHVLFEKYSGKMMGICLRYCSDKMQAEDVLMKGFMKVFTKMETYRGPVLEAWMRRIFVHLAIEEYRKNRIENSRLLHVEVEHLPEPEPVWDSLPVNEILLEMIEKLPDTSRLVFNLYEIEGHSYAEISELLGMAESSCRSALTRARQSLYAQLKQTENL
jgi:RNA polymerase sigma-70 factor (ECF subfamily)